MHLSILASQFVDCSTLFTPTTDTRYRTSLQYSFLCLSHSFHLQSNIDAKRMSVVWFPESRASLNQVLETEMESASYDPDLAAALSAVPAITPEEVSKKIGEQQ